MPREFKKLMLEQLQESLNNFSELTKKPIPKAGWIRTIREALGMSSSILANKLNCSRSNISSIEQREKKGTINLETLAEVAQAMNCKLVYCLVPLEPLTKQLEDQARAVAKKQIRTINHSMTLEQQGLTPKQLQQQEDDLVKELLEGNLKNIWDNDEI
jgi:predicted DNA-binding mobile mystery protein A